MFSKIEIRGLGPHERTVLHFDAKGQTEIQGPSEAGKSTLMDAVCFVLWGMDRNGKRLDDRAIRDGHREVRVDLTLANGTVVSRTLQQRTKAGARGKTERTKTKHGETTEFTTDKDWHDSLKWMGEQPELLRQVLVPFAWLPLAQGAGTGRPLRDMLNRFVGSDGVRQSVIADLMRAAGHEFLNGDPVNQNEAMAWRRRAGQQRDNVAGRLEGRRRDVEALEESPVPDMPNAAELANAEDVLRREGAWAAGDKIRARIDVNSRAIATATGAHKDWQRRRAELGERPSESDGLRGAEQRVADIEGRLNRTAELLSRTRSDLEGVDTTRRTRHPERHLTDRVNDTKRRLSDALAAMASGTDICPHCNRPGWTEAVKTREVEVAEAKKAAELAETALTERMQELATLEDMRLSSATAAKKAHEKKAKEHLESLERLREERKRAQEDLARERAGSSAATEWDRRMSALGREPVVPARLAGPPDPAFPRPNPDEVRAADEIVRRRESAHGAAQARRQGIQRLTVEVSKDEEELERHTRKFARLNALVDAVRREPSESLRRMFATLGDLGPVTLELLENGGVNVLVEGRPWHLASTGKQVVADVWIRAALRRALGRRKLPVFVDCAQDVGGQELPAPAPAIILTTNDAPVLEAISPSRAA